MQQLSLSSQAVYILSVNEASAGGWERVGAEHLYLALCKVTNFERADSEMIIQHLGKDKGNADEVQADFVTIKGVFWRVPLDPNRSRYALRKIIGKGGVAAEDSVLHRTEACRQVYREADKLAKETGSPMVKPVHLLWALCKSEDCLPMRHLRKEGVDITLLVDICRDAGGKTVPGPGKKEPKETEKTKSKTELLDRIGRDLTALAAEGKLPTVIGRKGELLQVIQGLLRADKNGVVLIGEPGVGKTCIVEGLAQLIASGRISERLQKIKGKRVVEITASSLLAGTRYRGEFEERMEQLIAECEMNKDAIILFVDELHTLMGAGKGGDGAMDAGNILKPALSRGRINLVGATTTDEYTRYIEKDGAIDRRLIKVYVNEPSKEETREIMAGLRENIEAQYTVRLQEEAIQSAIDYSVRFLPHRRLPDKAVDIVHQACANKLCAGDLGSFWTDPKSSHGSWLGAEAVITPRDIALVISGLSKIPLSKIIQSPDEKIETLKEELSRRIIGQKEALETVCRAVRSAQLGLTERHRPDGVFFLLGPTGVGKTELAKAVADALFYQSKDHFIRIDMSEYQEKHQVSRLIGAAPGYVGYEQEGILTGALRKQPYAVVLFDEVEKAHPDIFDLFLQVFDEGQLTDTHGRRADFSNTLIFLTSNLGARSDNPMGIALGDREKETTAEKENFRQGVMKAVRKFMRPELINRIDHIVIFDYLRKEDSAAIARSIINSHMEKLLTEHRMKLVLTEESLMHLVEKGYNRTYGARELKRVIEKLLIQRVAQFIFDHPGGGEKVLECFVDGENGLGLRELPAE
jgi:ATP-dependent Clp protease ATP-binding subunit ClpC